MAGFKGFVFSDSDAIINRENTFIGFFNTLASESGVPENIIKRGAVVPCSWMYAAYVGYSRDFGKGEAPYTSVEFRTRAYKMMQQIDAGMACVMGYVPSSLGDILIDASEFGGKLVNEELRSVVGLGEPSYYFVPERSQSAFIQANLGGE